MKNSKIYILFGIFLCAVLLYSQGLNSPGFEYRDDEIFYFKSTKEMLENKNYLSPTYFGENRFQKPILFYWFILLSYHVGGISWFAARFASVIFAALTACLTWFMVEKYFDRKTAFLSTLILVTLPQFFRHAKNAVPDMTLNFFIVAACFFVFEFFENPQKIANSRIFFVLCALGFLVKGFVAVLIPLLIVFTYAWIGKQAGSLRKIHWFEGLLVFFLLVSPWFLFMFFQHGSKYFSYMLLNETWDRVRVFQGSFVFGNFFWNFLKNFRYYSGVIFSYFAPWSLFILPGVVFAFLDLKSAKRERNFLLWLILWFFIVFCFFSSIQFTINHYILILSTPFAILCSRFLLHPIVNRIPIRRSLKGLFVLLFIFGMLGLLFMYYFMGEGTGLGIAIAALTIIIAFVAFLKSRSLFYPACMVGFLMLFVIGRPEYLNRSGISAHATWQKMSEALSHEFENTSGDIGVGSRDLHEKELQVYFDRQIIKIASWEKETSRDNLIGFMDNPKNMYLLILDKDLDVYNGVLNDEFKVLYRDSIFRKRVNIDMNFFIRIFCLDKSVVNDYLLEDVVLFKRSSDA